MAVLRMQVYGGQFMLSVPQAYVKIYGIKPGDLYEISRTNKGFLYRHIEDKDITSDEFGKRKRTGQIRGKGGETK